MIGLGLHAVLNIRSMQKWLYSVAGFVYYYFHTPSSLQFVYIYIALFPNQLALIHCAKLCITITAFLDYGVHQPFPIVFILIDKLTHSLS